MQRNLLKSRKVFRKMAIDDGLSHWMPFLEIGLLKELRQKQKKLSGAKTPANAQAEAPKEEVREKGVLKDTKEGKIAKALKKNVQRKVSRKLDKEMDKAVDEKITEEIKTEMDDIVDDKINSQDVTDEEEKAFEKVDENKAVPSKEFFKKSIEKVKPKLRKEAAAKIKKDFAEKVKSSVSKKVIEKINTEVKNDMNLKKELIVDKLKEEKGEKATDEDANLEGQVKDMETNIEEEVSRRLKEMIDDKFNKAFEARINEELNKRLDKNIDDAAQTDMQIQDGTGVPNLDDAQLSAIEEISDKAEAIGLSNISTKSKKTEIQL